MDKMTTTKTTTKTTIPANILEADYTPAQRLMSHLQPIPGAVLVAIATGAVDVRAVVLDELAQRGLDPTTGLWIGFPAAEKKAAAMKAAL